MTEPSLDSASLATFEGRLGDTFTIRSDELPDVELRLTEANPLGGDSDHRDPFALIFMGPMEPVLQQATYALEHEQLGSLLLFLVPVGPDKDQTGIQYEAVFS